jgi:hypothetical protein
MWLKFGNQDVTACAVAGPDPSATIGAWIGPSRDRAAHGIKRIFTLVGCRDNGDKIGHVRLWREQFAETPWGPSLTTSGHW